MEDSMLTFNIILISLLINLIINFGKKSSIMSCGIVGFSAFEGKQSSVNNLRTLMLANMKRGPHATGMFYGEEIIKEADIVDIFLSKNDIKSSEIFIGHVRNASIGNKGNKNNAHPFERDGIIGVHNGTIRGWLNLANKLNISHADVTVDSDLIIKAIANHKDKEDPYKVFSELEGAATLIWADREDLKRIYAYREGERPLYYGQTDEGIYFSSTKESLMLIKAESITMLLTNKVHCFIDGKLSEKHSKSIVFPVKKPIVSYDPFFNQHNNNSNKTELEEKHYFMLFAKDTGVVDSKKGDLFYSNEKPKPGKAITVTFKSNSHLTMISRIITDIYAAKLGKVKMNNFCILIQDVDVHNDDGSTAVLKAGTKLFTLGTSLLTDVSMYTCMDIDNAIEYEIEEEFIRGLDYEDYNVLFCNEEEEVKKVITNLDLNQFDEAEIEKNKINTETEDPYDYADFSKLITDISTDISSAGFNTEKLHIYINDLIKYGPKKDKDEITKINKKVILLENELNEMILELVALNSSMLDLKKK